MDEGCLGQPRAKSICSFLQELNDAVKAKFVEETPATLIDTNPSFFSQFTIVIATQVCSSASFYELQKYDCSAVINKYSQTFECMNRYMFFYQRLKKMLEK